MGNKIIKIGDRDIPGNTIIDSVFNKYVIRKEDKTIITKYITNDKKDNYLEVLPGTVIYYNDDITPIIPIHNGWFILLYKTAVLYYYNKEILENQKINLESILIESGFNCEPSDIISHDIQYLKDDEIIVSTKYIIKEQFFIHNYKLRIYLISGVLKIDVVDNNFVDNLIDNKKVVVVNKKILYYDKYRFELNGKTTDRIFNLSGLCNFNNGNNKLYILSVVYNGLRMDTYDLNTLDKLKSRLLEDTSAGHPNYFITSDKRIIRIIDSCIISHKIPDSGDNILQKTEINLKGNSINHLLCRVLNDKFIVKNMLFTSDLKLIFKTNDDDNVILNILKLTHDERNLMISYLLSLNVLSLNSDLIKIVTLYLQD